MKIAQKAGMILTRLKKEYPERGEFVKWNNPLELVIGTILSAQCTDKQVNKVTKQLFRRYRTAQAFANADVSQLEKEIFSTGFYRAKARYIKRTAQLLIERHKGRVPQTREGLLTLPGVSYKTANLIMAKAFSNPTGVAVDTHVKRLSKRMGLTQFDDPKKIETDLNKLYQPDEYLDVNEYMIMHGRAICTSKPKCQECVIQDICPFGKHVLNTINQGEKNRR